MWAARGHLLGDHHNTTTPKLSCYTSPWPTCIDIHTYIRNKQGKELALPLNNTYVNSKTKLLFVSGTSSSSRAARNRVARVMGGEDGERGEWCWQVALINSLNQYLCGAALIGTQWVLTAAHCVTKWVTHTLAYLDAKSFCNRLQKEVGSHFVCVFLCYSVISAFVNRLL